jgi:hypothetical protein
MVRSGLIRISLRPRRQPNLLPGGLGKAPFPLSLRPGWWDPVRISQGTETQAGLLHRLWLPARPYPVAPDDDGSLGLFSERLRHYVVSDGSNFDTVLGVHYAATANK